MKIGLGTGFLVIIFAISKEILVFNAETIVLISTVLTTFLLVKYAGGALLEVLDEEANQVEEAFEKSRTLEKEIVNELKAYYALQGAVAKELGTLYKALNEQLVLWLSTRQALFDAEWKSAVEQKLVRLSSLEKQAVDAFQNTFVSVFNNQAYSATTWSDISEAQLAEIESILGVGNFAYWSIEEVPSKTTLKDYEHAAKVAVQTAGYEFLGEASQQTEATLKDQNYKVEFYYEDDFYSE
jgi:hypothetical protein